MTRTFGNQRNVYEMAVMIVFARHKDAFLNRDVYAHVL